jgi:hypothetical protein
MKRFYLAVILLLMVLSLRAQQWYWTVPMIGYIEAEEDTLAVLDNSNDLFTTGILRHWARSGELVGEQAEVLEEENLQERTRIPEHPPLLLYPNPFRDHITVSGVKEGNKARLFDAVGNEIRSWQLKGERNELDTQTVEPGIYLLQIDTGTVMVVRKMVKQ